MAVGGRAVRLGIGLDRTIARVVPRLHPALAAPAARDDLLAVAAQLPAVLSSCLYFEAPLGVAVARLDLILRVDPAARAILARATDDSIGVAIPRGAVWGRIRELAARWASPGSMLWRACTALWLEFDVRGGVREQLAGSCGGSPPGVFMDVMPTAAPHPSAMQPHEWPAEVLGPLMHPEALRGCATPLRRCLDALPQGARVASLGLMLPRSASTIRVCVLGLALDMLPTYLRAAGWPGSLERLGALLRELALRGPAVAPTASLIHLDVDRALVPRIGIEYSFRRDVQYRGDFAERAFLDRLVDLGLCTPGKREAMLAWPGAGVDELPHELWPSVVRRRVNHVKVVCDERRGPHAKGYLRVTHSFCGRCRDLARGTGRTHGSATPGSTMQGSTTQGSTQ